MVEQTLQAWLEEVRQAYAEHETEMGKPEKNWEEWLGRFIYEYGPDLNIAEYIIEADLENKRES